MIELIRTDDPVLLSWLETRLAEIGIEAFVFDGHTSNAYAGALGSVSCRIMVAEDDLSRAMRVVAEGRGLAGQE
jgi:hypothetical protein